MGRISFFNVIILGLCALMICGIAAEYLFQNRITTEVGTYPAVDLPALPKLTAAQPIPSMAEAIARPLFLKLRRPVAASAPTEVETAPPPAPSTQYELVGIVKGITKKLVVLRRKSSRATIRIEEGGQLDQWVVSQILVDRLKLTAPGMEAELLFSGPPSRQIAPATGSSSSFPLPNGNAPILRSP